MESYSNKLKEDKYIEKECCWITFCDNCCWLDYVYCLTSWIFCCCECDKDCDSTLKRTCDFILLIIIIILVVLCCTVGQNT